MRQQPAVKAGTGIGKGQRHLEVLEKGLIIPIAPEEREIQEDDLSLVDCLRLLRGIIRCFHSLFVLR